MTCPHWFATVILYKSGQTSELKRTFITERCCMEINTSVFLPVCLFFLNRYATDDGLYSVYDKSVGFAPVIGNRSSGIPSQCHFSKFINDLSTTCCIWNFACSITVGSDFKKFEVFNIIQNRKKIRLLNNEWFVFSDSSYSPYTIKQLGLLSNFSARWLL